MRFLIDTHVFIWLDTDPTQISQNVTKLLSDAANTILLSHASIWEMQIKLGLGKLDFTIPFQALIQSQVQQNRMTLLPIEVAHIFTLDTLPLHHRDPFDRMLIAQSITEGISILSHDSVFARYPVKVIW